MRREEDNPPLAVGVSSPAGDRGVVGEDRFVLAVGFRQDRNALDEDDADDAVGAGLHAHDLPLQVAALHAVRKPADRRLAALVALVKTVVDVGVPDVFGKVRAPGLRVVAVPCVHHRLDRVAHGGLVGAHWS